MDKSLKEIRSSKFFRVKSPLRNKNLYSSYYQTHLNSNLRRQFQQLCNEKFLPNRKIRTMHFSDRLYLGLYSADGSRFVTATQHGRIVVFDSSLPKIKRLLEFPARNIGWAPIDLEISQDNRFLFCSSWSNRVMITKLEELERAAALSNSSEYGSPSSPNPASSASTIDALQNSAHSYLTVPHSLLRGVHHVAGFRILLNKCADRLVLTSNRGLIFFFDVAHARIINCQSEAHLEDVNAGCLADDSGNVIVSGSDDASMKIWDQRCLNAGPSGVLYGHQSGITFMDAKENLRYILSNSKDQSIKIWDLRFYLPPDSSQHQRIANWDYRWDSVPAFDHNAHNASNASNSSTSSNTMGKFGQPSQDQSLLTLIGHRVQFTLLRARFSPLQSTNQRFVYAGDTNNRWHLWDLQDLKPAASTHSFCAHLDDSSLSSSSVFRPNASYSDRDLLWNCSEAQRSSLFFSQRYHNQLFASANQNTLIRDISWHPFKPNLITSNFAGELDVWEYRNPVTHPPIRTASATRGGAAATGGSGWEVENNRIQMTDVDYLDEEEELLSDDSFYSSD